MIEVRNLSKSYGSTQAIEGVDFTLPAGQVLAFLGPNGAGKSTTMKILAGYIAPDGGRALVGGFDAVRQTREAQRLIGYLPEHNPLYEEMAVVDFLQFVASAVGIPKDRRRAQIAAAVEACDLGDVLHKSVGALSKGYRQRVGLAQALSRDPKILILDEPTGGLDPNQRRDILELIRRVGREKTVIHSTHLLDEVRRTSDRTIVIHRGKIVADGSPRQIASAAGGEATVRVSLATNEMAARVALDGLEAVREVELVEEDDLPAGAPAPEPAAKGKSGKKKQRAASREPGDKNHPAVFRLLLKPGRDCRREVWELSREKGWPLLELVLETPSLEDIFQRLTTD
jgi:ABC-2 type transport system ATP-binding protein